MKRFVYSTFLFFVFCSGVAQAQDSLFFYKSGDIIYRESMSRVDSVSFLATDYYNLLRSDIVYNNLKSNAQLTLFAQMIQIAGYEKALDNVTIWAPVNSALSQIELSDTALVKRLVSNHISKSKINAFFFNDSISVTMLNNKHYILKMVSGIISLDGTTILTHNNYVANSIIHIMNSYVPYKMNIWEYITQGTGHDLMKAYVNSQTKTSYNSSTGTYVTTNDLLDQLTFINNEDTLSSAIVLSDNAWTEAYTKLYPYCAVSIDGSEEAHVENTKLAIIHNNFYMGKPELLTSDSVIKATSGYQLKSPAVLLEGAQSQELSNGKCFLVNQTKMFDSELGNKEIRIEAEGPNYGFVFMNFDVYKRSAVGNVGFNISNGYYIYLKNTSTNNFVRASVEYTFPSTMVSKYNVYCVFVPGAIVNSTDTRPNKVNFFLSYLDANGNQVLNKAVSATNTLDASPGTFTTNPTTMTKMLVLKDFQFPFSNLILNLKRKPVQVSLRVDNATRTTETVSYNRDISIDCIILEPVQ